MTVDVAPQCLACAHFRSPLDGVVAERTCDAYPSGIPVRIWSNQADHRESQRGDNGVRWESNGAAFPEWALSGDR